MTALSQVIESGWPVPSMVQAHNERPCPLHAIGTPMGCNAQGVVTHTTTHYDMQASDTAKPEDQLVVPVGQYI